MPEITFIEHDGNQKTVEAEVGQSVMQVAVNHLVPGIVADCGGACSCATCHGYVDDAWVARVPAAGDDENAMLDFTADREANSRLTCQIRMTSELDGLKIHLPASQY